MRYSSRQYDRRQHGKTLCNNRGRTTLTGILSQLFMRKELTARAIILSGDFLLTLKPERKKIFFTPGGRVEQGESLETALAREMSEELPNVGYELGPLIGTIEHRWREPSGEEVLGVHHFFRVCCPNLKDTITPQSVEKGLLFAWQSVEKLTRYPIQPPSLAYLVPRLLSGIKETWSGQDLGA